MILHGRITKNKSWEFQIDTFEVWNIFEFQISWRLKGDHAGFEVRLELVKWHCHFIIYDNRHWDDKNNKFLEGEHGQD